MSRFRLLLISGCLAVAVASALSGYQLSLRATLVGAALVAAVLLLALRRNSVQVRTAVAAPSEAAPAQESGAARHGAPRPRRLFGRQGTDTLDLRISAIARQIEGYEQKLLEMARAQTVADLARQQELVDVRRQLAQLQAVNDEQRATIASLHQQHARRLARLQETMAGQREALADLESTLETALATASDALVATDSTP